MEVDHEDPVLWEGMKMAENEIDTEEENGNGEGKETIYSYSMLKTFENCRLSFFKKYVIREEVLSQTVEAFMGTIVHDTLQRTFMEKKKGRLHTKEETLNFYDAHWDSEFAKMRERGVKIISVQGPAGAKVQIETTPETLAEIRKRGRAMVDAFYDKNCPFPDAEGNIEVEKEIIFTLNARKVKAKIDAFVSNSGVCKIFEFKTGKYMSIPEWEAQVSVYVLGAIEHEGDGVVVEPTVFHLSTGEKYPMTSLTTEKNIEDVKMQLMAGILGIEWATQDWTLKDAAKYPAEPAHPHLCPWCQFYNECRFMRG